MQQFIAVSKFEYLRTVKKPAFWFTTLFLPAFMVVVMAISLYGSSEGEKKLTELAENIDSVYVLDETGIIKPELLQDPLKLTDSLEKSISEVKSGEIDALIYYPSDLIEKGEFQVFAKENGLLGNTPFSALASSLLKQSAIGNIKDPAIQAAVAKDFSEKTTPYDDQGEVVKIGIEKFVVPIFSMIIFFLSVFLGSSLLLQSVSEEKENRMMETLLSMIKPKTLIYGKIFGLSGAVLTQLAVWVGLGLVIVSVAVSNSYINIPIDFSLIQLNALPVNIYFTLMGFLLYSAIMVGVGAVTTNYKESSNLSAVFIIMGIIPLYLLLVLLSDPNGVIAQITSYFPFTAPMIWVIRNSIVELPLWEVLFGMFIVFVYTLIAFNIAIKMFNLGALMNNRKPNLREVMHTLRK